MGKSLTHKIIEQHLISGEIKSGTEITIDIDHVLVQDITGTQVFLHFEAIGLERIGAKVAVCYADHNVLQIKAENMEDHLYLQSAAKKFGVWFSKPANGIGHQIHQEHFAVPGTTAVGADSHTPHNGGMGVLAIGAGGLDVAVALGGGGYSFVMPKVVNVHLTGELKPWSTAKDVILEMLRRITVRGGFGKIFEYSGPGIKTLNVQQRVTITNMGTEMGATTSIFPSDEITKHYFEVTGRPNDWKEMLPDDDAEYDERIELDLSKIVPLVAQPSLPDKVVPVRDIAGVAIEQVMVGSCTNGAYADLKAVAKIMKGRQVHPDVNFFIHAASRMALEQLAEEGYLEDLLKAGVNVAEPTCGACIGSGHVPAPGARSLRAVNRNFRGRSGFKDDLVYLASPETAAATAITGVLTDPSTLGMEAPPSELPPKIRQDNPNLIPPASEADAKKLKIRRGDNIVPADPKDVLHDTISGEVLIKVEDDISTDHIMPAAAEILAYRSNIPKISEYVYYRLDPTFSARAKAKGGGFIVGGENYGQGSSREHAALAPMYLGVKGVIAKSFARIHHSNLVNFGLLPLTFKNKDDYDFIEKGDELVIKDCLASVDKATFTIQNTTRGYNIETEAKLTDRQKELLKLGGLLTYTRKRGMAKRK
ncbi:MAG: aconitate hydratase [candidate division Zixibacteria bacterium HGW-Zixibacteria-1]|nr:MAG: aconitate hydratase [candidate division Zixibacteria bacterium HGW-Zixibacteria-1]